MKGEPALIKSAKQLDQNALLEIFDCYAPAIYQYVLRLCQDPIESDQIVGDVFARLLEQFAAGQGPSTNLRCYVYQTTYHLVVDHAGYNRRLVSLETEIDAAPKLVTKLTATEIEEQALMAGLVFALRNHLSELQQHVIILRFLEGFSLKDTAIIVDKSVTNVKVTQNRAIEKLHKSLGLRLLNRRKTVSSPE